jgi:hypothetical protein
MEKVISATMNEDDSASSAIYNGLVGGSIHNMISTSMRRLPIRRAKKMLGSAMSGGAQSGGAMSGGGMVGSLSSVC